MKKSKKKERVLYNRVKSKLSLMRFQLKIKFMDPKIDESEEDTIFTLVKGLHEMENVFFDLLLDRKSAKEIQEERKTMFEKWIVQSLP